MSELPRPRYPVFVPSKGRAHVRSSQTTVGNLLRDGVPFRLVVEPSEAERYAQRYPDAALLVTPRDDMRLLGVRNWIRDVSIDEGADRHWQLDDNVRHFARLYRGQRIRCDSGVALRVCEDLTDRYTNVGLSGLNYRTFVRPDCTTPFYVNVHVYSVSLISNRMPYRWRSVYNDDTDLCLQVLSGGLCTIAVNAFMANKEPTMRVAGGNTDDLYRGDGRARMARSLERQWPHVVTTERRFGRPQHVVRGSWRGFDTPLQRRTDIDWSALGAVDEYGLRLVQKAETVTDPAMRKLLLEVSDAVS